MTQMLPKDILGPHFRFNLPGLRLKRRVSRRTCRDVHTPPCQELCSCSRSACRNSMLPSGNEMHLQMIERGDWQVSDIARNAFDLEHKVVGTIGAGRIGYRVLQRLRPFDCKELLYYDYTPLPDGACTRTSLKL